MIVVTMIMTITLVSKVKSNNNNLNNRVNWNKWSPNSNSWLRSCNRCWL